MQAQTPDPPGLNFEEFLERQQQHLERRAAKMVHLRDELDAGLHHPPSMSRGSLRLIMRNAAHADSATWGVRY
jgi:hypothetical protein